MLVFLHGHLLTNGANPSLVDDVGPMIIVHYQCVMLYFLMPQKLTRVTDGKITNHQKPNNKFHLEGAPSEVCVVALYD